MEILQTGHLHVKIYEKICPRFVIQIVVAMETVT